MDRFTTLRVSILCLLIAGCGGGDGGDGSVNNDGSDGGSEVQPGASVGNTNGGLQGFVWLERDSEIFDLDTGSVTRVGSLDGARPRADGREFVTLDSDVRFTDDPLCEGRFTDFDSVSIHDTVSGLAVAGFEVQADLRTVPRLSPDGQTVAAHWSENSICFSTETNLTVWTRDGTELIRGAAEIGDFDWLPDNRLVFEINGDISVETERNTFRAERITNLGNVPGVPRALDVSPDGNSVVFEMVTDSNLLFSTVDFREATVWRVNIDGTGLEQIVTSTVFDEEPRINAPMFSPAGDELMVTEGWLSGGAVSFIGFDSTEFPIITGSEFVPVISGPVTHVVPLDQLSVALPPPSFSAEAVRPVFSRDDDDSLAPARLWPLEGRVWTETLSLPSVQPGSLPMANGQINRGLSGTVYRLNTDSSVVEEPELQRLDTASGSESTVIVPAEIPLDDIEEFAVSDDESTFAIVTSEFVDYTLWTFSEGGLNLQSFALDRDSQLRPEGPPRFAPELNNLLAWVYDDGNFGQSVVIMNTDNGGFLRADNLGYVDDFAWFPNGDLLIVDGANLSRATLINGSYASTPLASLHTRTNGIALHPDGQSLVYAGNRQLVLLNLVDGTRRRLTAWNGAEESLPTFSPDGQYILFKKHDRETVSFGWPWIIANDANDIRISDGASSPGAMRIGEGSSIDWRVTRNRLVWR